MNREKERLRNEDLEMAIESLAQRVEEFFVTRYPGEDLATLRDRLLGDERGMASALHDWRTAALWPSPETIGELRCASCQNLMGDEPSAAEDEEICADCASEMPLVPSHD